MFTIQWYVANGPYEAITATPTAAWEIYWALKKSCQKAHNQEDYWIRIFRGNMPLNPEKGSALPACQPNENSYFILKKAEE